MDDELSNYYRAHVTQAFFATSHGFEGDRESAGAMLEPFLVRFWPVLRHYHAKVVGECLGLSYDAPELGRTSQLHGFGLMMRAGDHPQAYDGRLGSFRDDGSYLAAQAYDFFAGALR